VITQAQKAPIPFGTELLYYKDGDYWTWTFQVGDAKPSEILGLISNGKSGMAYTDPARVMFFSQDRKTGDVTLNSMYWVESKTTTVFDPPQRSLKGDLSGAAYEFLGITPSILGSASRGVKETISTPLGRVDTLKFIKDYDSTVTTYWFNGTIGVNVKMEIFKKESGEILTMLLKKTNVLK
jgi:hypothetical protein